LTIEDSPKSTNFKYEDDDLSSYITLSGFKSL